MSRSAGVPSRVTFGLSPRGRRSTGSATGCRPRAVWTEGRETAPREPTEGRNRLHFCDDTYTHARKQTFGQKSVYGEFLP